MIRKTSKILTQNIQNVQILSPILKPFAWLFRLVARLFCDLFFEPSGGYPLGPILGSTGAPLVRFS